MERIDAVDVRAITPSRVLEKFDLNIEYITRQEAFARGPVHEHQLKLAGFTRKEMTDIYEKIGRCLEGRSWLSK